MRPLIWTLAILSALLLSTAAALVLVSIWTTDLALAARIARTGALALAVAIPPSLAAIIIWTAG